MREILFIAYYFPPLGGSGVVRPVKFAKYLPQWGWKPTILTVEGGDSFFYDDSMLSELPEIVSVARVPSYEAIRTTRAKEISDQLSLSGGRQNWVGLVVRTLKQFLKAAYFSVSIPDDKVGWCVPAAQSALQLARERSFQAILATSPPQSDLVIATWLKHRLRIPVVLDYRDEWTTNPHKYMPNPVTLWLNRLLERWVIRQADLLLVMSAGVQRNLYDYGLFSHNSYTSCYVLPNGYDPADYDGTPCPSSAKFRIVYTGSFYGDLRIPDPFLLGLHAWLDQSPQSRADVEVLFLGSIYPRHRQLISALGLDDVVHIDGMVSHHEAVAAQQSASVLLLIMGKGEGTAILPGKVFEYMGARRPILGIVHPEGESAHLLRQTATGTVVDPDDVAAIGGALKTLFGKWREGRLCYSPNLEKVIAYSRQEQAHRLCDLLDQLVHG
jgi:glycosyltransferase involved in cell wall biosynthesis